MGTNFYYKIPLSKREIQDLKDSITEDPSLSTFEDLAAIYTDKKVIHLGKRSYGWQFLWNYNDGDFYKDNLESIIKFLKEEGGWIENEYGDKFNVEQFFNEIQDCLYKDENHCDAISYHLKHPEEPCYEDPSKHEYQSSGLRFSRHSEFS
jgi:hypothetical protein